MICEFVLLNHLFVGKLSNQNNHSEVKFQYAIGGPVIFMS